MTSPDAQRAACEREAWRLLARLHTPNHYLDERDIATITEFLLRFAQAQQAQAWREAKLKVQTFCEESIDNIGAHVNAECENGCGTKFRSLLHAALQREKGI